MFLLALQFIAFLACVTTDYTIPEMAEHRSFFQKKCIEENGIDYCREHGSSSVERVCRAQAKRKDISEDIAEK